MSRSFARRRGQGTVEYLILVALAVGVVAGVVYPIISKQVQSVQDTVAARASSVLSQQEMGIPICWFFCDSAKSVNLGANGPGGALGTAGTGKNGSDKNAADKNAQGGKGGSGAGGDGADNLAGGPNRPNANGPRGRQGGGASGADDDAESKAKKVDSRTAGSGGSSFKSGGEVTGDDEKKKKPDDPAADEKAAEKEGDSNDAIAKGRQALTRDADTRGGGCRDMNLFMLLKLAALIAVIVIVVAVALSSRGRKKNG